MLNKVIPLIAYIAIFDHIFWSAAEKVREG